ncbi:hypothetical protein ACFL1G_07945 [Planctomycetota bacterium]
MLLTLVVLARRKTELMGKNRKLLCFVHIEKTAGVTLDYVLRRNFFPCYMDVRPFSAKSNMRFTAKDLQKALTINPFLRCISGHSISAVEDLGEVRRNIDYITLLRQPVKRYLSYFDYTVRVLGRENTFDNYLQNEDMANFQTKKIAGCADVTLAKEILKEHFLLVGIVKEFDAFLLQLRQQLQPRPFDPLYVRRNVTAQCLKMAIPKPTDHKKAAAEERNKLDMELYDFVREHILPKQRREYGPRYDKDLERLKLQVATWRPRMLKSYADYALRKLYYDPMIGVLRLCAGLPYKGSY